MEWECNDNAKFSEVFDSLTVLVSLVPVKEGCPKLLVVARSGQLDLYHRPLQRGVVRNPERRVLFFGGSRCTKDSRRQEDAGPRPGTR